MSPQARQHIDEGDDDEGRHYSEDFPGHGCHLHPPCHPQDENDSRGEEELAGGQEGEGGEMVGSEDDLVDDHDGEGGRAVEQGGGEFLDGGGGGGRGWHGWLYMTRRRR